MCAFKGLEIMKGLKKIKTAAGLLERLSAIPGRGANVASLSFSARTVKGSAFGFSGFFKIAAAKEGRSCAAEEGIMSALPGHRLL
ncbi:UNVERIFIED_CONTAM: hypothetical protein K2H54_037369 [Gekko kuhli]